MAGLAEANYTAVLGQLAENVIGVAGLPAAPISLWAAHELPQVDKVILCRTQNRNSFSILSWAAG